jgi:hypothetical protein
MVSKDKYYERKAAGLCTKCGKSREGSPSKARCLACHNKLKNKQEAKKASEQRKPDATNVDKEISQKEKMESLKKNALLAKAENTPKICGLCGEGIGSFNLFCQKCIKITVFTKADAISRYGSVCDVCNEKDLRKLKIVSSDIGASMKHKDYDLFKVICYRRNPAPEFKVQCYACYWTDNNVYVKKLKAIYKQHGIFDEFLDNDDVIDVT